MAIIHIATGDTNNQGRVKLNDTFDEMITGTTSATTYYDYELKQFDGTSLVGSVSVNKLDGAIYSRNFHILFGFGVIL